MSTQHQTDTKDRMDTEERIQFAHPEPGAHLEGVACLAQRQAKTAKNGNPYAVITLRNQTGSMTGKVWAEQLPRWQDIPVGRAVRVSAEVVPGWQGALPELEIRTVEALAEGHWVERELNPICPMPGAALEARFAALEALIERTGMRRLLRVVLQFVGWENYSIAPAASGHHHAYLRGLLEHSLEVAELAVAASRLPRWAERLDRDALIVGALLHDLGKVHEYVWEDNRDCPVPIAVGPLGRLLPHVVLGPMLTWCAAKAHWEDLRRAGLRRMDVEHLMHVQVSHHATREWGSPVEPCTAEAMLIHTCDIQSARMRGLLDVLERSEADAQGWIPNPGWPHKHPILDLARVPGPRPVAEEMPAEAA